MRHASRLTCDLCRGIGCLFSKYPAGSSRSGTSQRGNVCGNSRDLLKKIKIKLRKKTALHPPSPPTALKHFFFDRIENKRKPLVKLARARIHNNHIYTITHISSGSTEDVVSTGRSDKERLVPNRGMASDTWGKVSATRFRNTVNESKMVTPATEHSLNTASDCGS